MRAITTGLLIALVLTAGLAIHVVAIAHSVATAPSGTIESVLEARGHTVTRGFIPPWARLASDYDILILDGTRPLLEPERGALRRFVEGGGNVWISTLGPLSDQLWDEGVAGVHTSAGALFAADGTAPLMPTSIGEVRASTTLRSWALSQSGFTSLLATRADTFRDVNGNARLDEGEPAGAFVVVAEATRGRGRVVIAAAPEWDALRDVLPEFARLATGPEPARILIIPHVTASPPTSVTAGLAGVAALAHIDWRAALVVILLAVPVLIAMPRRAAPPSEASANQAIERYQQRLRHEGAKGLERIEEIERSSPHEDA